MTHIEQMIQDMCPNGVEFKKLGEVTTIIRGERVTKSQLIENGQYPVVSGGVNPMGYIDKYNREENTITIAQYGSAGFVNYINEKFWANDVCYSVYPNEELINKFLYYYLVHKQGYFYAVRNTDAVPYSIALEKIKDLDTPIPPLEIQKKIVECLDKFSALAAELQAELQMRRKQYEYYRTQLLTPHSDCNSATKPDDAQWEWKTLGEIGEMIKGSGIQKSDFVEEGKPCIHYGQVHTFYGTFAYKNKSYISEELYAKCKKAHTGDLVIATTSEDVEACCKATAWLGDEDVAVSGDAHIYRHTQNPKYMAYLFQTEMFAQQKRRCATGAKVTRVHGDDMLKFRFPLPSLAEQERIVSILDKFEALTTSLSDGIPAEQAAQQKRYEYYRDLLLTFDRKAV